MRAEQFFRPAFANVFAFGFGLAAHSAGLPLAWVLGPMAGSATISQLGHAPFAPQSLRRGGQLIIGTTIGLNVTSSVLAVIAVWLPWMFASAALAIILSAALSVPLARFGRIGDKTAYFAMLPGGMSEMANLALASGARAEPVAIIHALRVAMVITIFPLLIIGFGDVAVTAASKPVSLADYAFVPVLLAIGFAGAFVAGLVRFNNPWIIGSLIAVAVASSSGLVSAVMPQIVFWAGQFLIGFTIGNRFTRPALAGLSRTTAVSAALIVFAGAVMFVAACGLSLLGEIDLATIALATTIGGAPEMAITAEILKLNVTLVIAFHLIRATIVNGFAGHIWTGLDRIGFFAVVGRLVGHSPVSDHGARI